MLVSASQSQHTAGREHFKRAGFLCGRRYDLRIRYVPVNFLEKFSDDRSTLLYFYQQVTGAAASTSVSFDLFKALFSQQCLVSWQVRSDYMQFHACKVSDGMALQLGCLEIR